MFRDFLAEQCERAAAAVGAAAAAAAQDALAASGVAAGAHRLAGSGGDGDTLRDAAGAARAAAGHPSETYNLTAVATCASAVKSIVPMLGLAPVQGSDVVAAGKNTHTLLLAGRFVDGTPCLAQVRMVSEEGAGVMIQVMAKSPNPTVALRVVNAIQ
ncbi:gamma-COP-domain-containing protein [Caulochytrium protostelioides]|uniref:Gamma-COP-domain-containing protein n=1 Tax=Caulochytrium protostelioides TaxID=1555241 RepID=A0A4P9WV26_9FUNG|nr:gamma-COP-domain-containing protein [Caulochytrium protostelioides]